MATYDEKLRAYKDAVEIVKAAYGSSSEYRIGMMDEILQKTYDKLVELIEDTRKQDA